jgi:hypothetical protein
MQSSNHDFFSVLVFFCITRLHFYRRY